MDRRRGGGLRPRRGVRHRRRTSPRPIGCWRRCCSPTSSTRPSRGGDRRPPLARARGHDQASARELERHGGREVKTMGDGFLATFDGPARASAAPRPSRRRPRDRIDIRAGLHTGECERRNGDIGGMAVHIGARVMSLAGPVRCSCRAPSRTSPSVPASSSRTAGARAQGHPGLLAPVRRSLRPGRARNQRRAVGSSTGDADAHRGGLRRCRRGSRRAHFGQPPVTRTCSTTWCHVAPKASQSRG